MIYKSLYKSELGMIILSSDGKYLTGYGGGLDVKIYLLEHEGINMDKYYKPKKGNAL